MSEQDNSLVYLDVDLPKEVEELIKIKALDRGITEEEMAIEMFNEAIVSFLERNGTNVTDSRPVKEVTLKN